MLLILIVFQLLNLISGSIAEELNRSLVYLPKADVVDENDYFKNNERYCYRLSWLGGSYYKDNFDEVMHKNCSEHFGEKSEILCIDPMAVTVSGREPDLEAARKKHYKDIICQLSNGEVCAKYTTYYNGITLRVVRYCTRIDIESEGPMRSGCLTEKNGSLYYEVCACVSGLGVGGICNGASALFESYKTLITFIISYYISHFVL